MDLQTTPSSFPKTTLSTGALGASGPGWQRASLDVPTGTSNDFAAAMQSALGGISAKLQEVKTVLGTSPQAQQQPGFAQMFQGFGVLVDQLAQIYGSTTGGGMAGAAASSVVTADAAGITSANNNSVTSAIPWASALVAGLGADSAAGAQVRQSTTSLAGPSASPNSAPSNGDSNAPSGTVATPGATVTWESYSSSTVYKGAKADYLERMQQSHSTDQWVIAALNKAIEQSVANGYDPEKSNAVNTLRGYFSGDAQARSNAIHSLDSNMLKAGGAYETVDYGLHVIAGAPPEGMNTTMPTFKSAYDKDWERPSVYDMINSSVGWSEKANSYADPATRDAALNRKLSDAEILAFQDGTLTPALAAMVAKLRGA